MQQLNLLDPRLLAGPALLNGRRLVALATLALAAVGGHFALETSRMAAVLAGAATAPAETTEATPAAEGATDPDAAMRQRVAQRQALRDLLAAGSQQAFNSAALLQGVIAALPAGAWLTDIELTRQRGVRIAGHALQAEELHAFAEQLQRLPDLRGIGVETLELQRGAGTPAADGNSGSPPSHRFVLASSAGAANPEAGR